MSDVDELLTAFEAAPEGEFTVSSSHSSSAINSTTAASKSKAAKKKASSTRKAAKQGSKRKRILESDSDSGSGSGSECEEASTSEDSEDDTPDLETLPLSGFDRNTFMNSWAANIESKYGGRDSEEEIDLNTFEVVPKKTTRKSAPPKTMKQLQIGRPSSSKGVASKSRGPSVIVTTTHNEVVQMMSASSISRIPTVPFKAPCTDLSLPRSTVPYESKVAHLLRDISHRKASNDMTFQARELRAIMDQLFEPANDMGRILLLLLKKELGPSVRRLPPIKPNMHPIFRIDADSVPSFEMYYQHPTNSLSPTAMFTNTNEETLKLSRMIYTLLFEFDSGGSLNYQ